MIYKLTGSLQNYVWGGHQYIPELLNIPADELPYLLKFLMSPNLFPFNFIQQKRKLK